MEFPEGYIHRMVAVRKQEIREAWSERNGGEPPDSLINQETAALLINAASNQVLERIAEVEDISVQPSEMERELAAFARDRELEPREAATEFERSGMRADLEASLRQQKALALVISEGVSATVPDKQDGLGDQGPESREEPEGAAASRLEDAAGSAPGDGAPEGREADDLRQ